MKAKDVLERLHKPQGHLSLESLWKTVCAEVYGGFVPGFTAKQRGQLKHFAGKCPESKAAEVMEFTLRNWLLLIKTAEADAGAFKTPAKPEIGFLLKYAGIAVSLWLKEAHKPKPAPVEPVQLIAQKPPPEPDPAPEEKPSAEDVLELFYGEEETQDA